jgi:hypothetical protein
MSRFPFFFDATPRVGDRLIAGAYGVKFEVLRFEDSEGQPEFDVQYELRGSIPADADVVCVFDSLLRELRQPRREGGAA